MKVLVLHKTKPVFEPRLELPLQDHYTPVAVVEVDDIALVFQVTNTIDHYWWENDEIKHRLFKGEGTRSTSVGDVYVTDLAEVYEVQPFGLQEMENVTLPSVWYEDFFSKIAPYTCPVCNSIINLTSTEDWGIDIWTGKKQCATIDNYYHCSGCSWSSHEDDEATNSVVVGILEANDKPDYEDALVKGAKKLATELTEFMDSLPKDVDCEDQSGEICFDTDHLFDYPVLIRAQGLLTAYDIYVGLSIDVDVNHEMVAVLDDTICTNKM